MKKTNKGFTLIELLAVIIILSVIAIIATPIVLSVVDKVKEQANLQTVNGILDSGRLYYTESMLDETKKEDIINVKNIYDKVYLQGNKPKTGSLYITDKGLTAISIILDKKCYIKNFDGEVEITKDETCDLGFVGKDEESPTLTFDYSEITGSNEWYKENMWLTIKANDTISGISKIKWCVSQGSKCEPTIEVFPKKDNKILTHGVNITTESEKNYVCALIIDVVGNTTSDCSKIIKLDKTTPSFDGIVDKLINIGEVIDLKDGVTASDVTSGIDITFTTDPSSIDTSKAGINNIKYIVSDNAGNKTEKTRKIVVDANAPTVTYTPQGSTINLNGWSNQDFYVKIDLVDNSGLGIKEGKWCITQSNTCTPNASISGTTYSPLVSTESNNNRICIQAIDNNNKQSEVICSTTYKLDKNAPILTVKTDSITIIEGDSVNTSTYFNAPTYSISGGSMSCNPINTSSMSIGNQEITCTTTGNNGLSTSVTKTIVVVFNEIIINDSFRYTGGVQEFIAPVSGYYKLEVWGASGGTSSYSGSGGYSKGIVYLKKGTKLYIYIGGVGQVSLLGGGFNGGGNPTGSYNGGGGATDIRINTDSLYSRVIVAGGGGGARNDLSQSGYGGGINGGSSNYNGSGKGIGGTQTSGGESTQSSAEWKKYMTNGIFGLGGSHIPSAGTINGFSGGGGGWYGGGGGHGAGGGSGYVYTTSTVSNYPSGCLLNSSYYLSNAITIAGNQSIPTYDGKTTTIGNSGNGYAKIRLINKTNNFSYTGSIEEFIIPKTGTYKLEVWGAQGGGVGTNVGFTGAYATSTYELNENTVLKILVGGKGGLGAGGGGTFITVFNNTPISIAGGGGGAGGGMLSGAVTNQPGDINYGQSTTNGGSTISGGGTNGAGGTGGIQNGPGNGGGGLLTNGLNGEAGTGGIAFINNGGSGIGSGTSYSGQNPGNGGFGGGGGAYNNNASGYFRGGGGGGYSGGQGGTYSPTTCKNAGGGGGGSYFIGNGSFAIAGNKSMPTYDGTSTMIGNVENGYAKITLIK